VQWVEALAAFERSNELQPHPTTLYNIGYCERALGRYTRARKMLTAALKPKPPADVLPEDLAKLARSYLKEIDTKLVRLVISVRGEGLLVAVDGRPLERQPAPVGATPVMVAGTRGAGDPEPVVASTFSLEIDSGEHVLVLSDSQTDTVRAFSIDFAAGTTSHLDLGLTDPKPAVLEPPNPAPVLPPPTETRLPDELGPSVSAPRVAAYVVFGIAGVGLVATVVSGGIALDRKSKLDEACGADLDNCPPGSQSDIDTMTTAAQLANAGLVITGVATAAGTVLWLAFDGDASSADTKPATGLRPFVGVGVAGISGWF